MQDLLFLLIAVVSIQFVSAYYATSTGIITNVEADDWELVSPAKLSSCDSPAASITLPAQTRTTPVSGMIFTFGEFDPPLPETAATIEQIEIGFNASPGLYEKQLSFKPDARGCSSACEPVSADSFSAPKTITQQHDLLTLYGVQTNVDNLRAYFVQTARLYWSAQRFGAQNAERLYLRCVLFRVKYTAAPVFSPPFGCLRSTPTTKLLIAADATAAVLSEMSKELKQAQPSLSITTYGLFKKLPSLSTYDVVLTWSWQYTMAYEGVSDDLEQFVDGGGVLIVSYFSYSHFCINCFFVLYLCVEITILFCGWEQRRR